MTCELTLRDVRSVARIVNLAHRFNCRCTQIEAAVRNGDRTRATMSFEGNPLALGRLRAQIDRILSYEDVA